MIYIIEKYCRYSESSHIDSVWEVDLENVEALFYLFLAAKAEELGVVINDWWYNMMNHKNHHPELTEEEYRAKKKLWKKVLKEWPIEKYISEVLKGKKLEYKTLNG